MIFFALKSKTASIDILDLTAWGKIHTKVWTQNTFVGGYMRPESVPVRIQETRNSVVGTDTRMEAGQPRNYSLPGGTREFSLLKSV
jgi:hypothetical protein